MVRDAEANAEADARRRKAIDAKNEMDSLIYSTEKSLMDNGGKLDAETKSAVEKAVAEAKAAKDSDDLELVTSKRDALSQASMKIGQAMYSNSSSSSSSSGDEKTDDNIVDTDFKEKTDDEKKDDKERNFSTTILLNYRFVCVLCGGSFLQHLFGS